MDRVRLFGCWYQILCHSLDKAQKMVYPMEIVGYLAVSNFGALGESGETMTTDGARRWKSAGQAESDQSSPWEGRGPGARDDAS